MGRRDAVQVTLEIVARCRQLLPALIVTYEPGWETRGNGTSANYDYGTMHHTASASSLTRPFPTQGILRDGRPGLSGPLCNSAGPACTIDAPRLHIMSANPANHAGASRQSGPVPALSLFNPRTWGHEIDYAGSVAMLAGQLLVAQVLTRAIADVLAGGNVEHVRGHAETSITGKWDPGEAPGQTIDMAAFRAASRTAGAPAPVLPPPPVLEDIMRIAVTPDSTCWLAWGDEVIATNSINEVSSLAKLHNVPVTPMTRAEVQECINTAARKKARDLAAISRIMPVADVDEDALVAKLLPPMLAQLNAATPVSEADIKRLLDDSEIDTVNLLASRLAASAA